MAAEGDNALPNGGMAYVRLPTFIKVFCQERHREEMRLPPEFVGLHGDELPFDCRLVWPNGVSWMVRLLKIASGCYICTGWPEFVRGNRIGHGDFLTFTLVDVGVFNVMRYDMGFVDFDIDGNYSPDVDTTDDYEPSEMETDSTDGEGYAVERNSLGVDSYPSFVVTLTHSHVRRTFEIPYSFWQRHIRMGALQEPVYLFTGENTWRVTLKHSASKIWVKKGWTKFKHDNNLVEGMRAHFQLVNLDEVQFYVYFENA